jgi:hypothetical protein
MIITWEFKIGDKTLYANSYCKKFSMKQVNKSEKKARKKIKCKKATAKIYKVYNTKRIGFTWCDYFSISFTISTITFLMLTSMTNFLLRT